MIFVGFGIIRISAHFADELISRLHRRPLPVLEGGEITIDADYLTAQMLFRIAPFSPHLDYP